LSSVDELHARLRPSEELCRHGHVPEAIESLRQFVAEKPDHFRPYHNFGYFHLLIKDYQNAAKYARIATEKMPAYAEAWFVLGKSLAQLGHLEEAEEALDEGLKLQPDNLGASNWLISTLSRARRYEEAASIARDSASRLGWTTPERCGLTFSQEPWFLGRIYDWTRILEPYLHKVQYGLEIGCMEGMSTIWTAESLLTPTGRLLVNDIIFRENFLNNVDKAGIKERLDLRKGSAADVLPALRDNDFDFAYVDGDHSPSAVFRDVVNALVLVKPASVIILDDYGKQNEKTAIGLDFFLRLFKQNVEVLDKRYQLVLRRLSGPVSVHQSLRRVWHDALSAASAAKLDELVSSHSMRAVKWLRSGQAQLR
jgi:hypothetical protein